MRAACGILALCFVLLIAASFSRPWSTTKGVASTVSFIKGESEKFASSTVQLEAAIAAIEGNDLNSILRARTALKQCRLTYKKLEFFLEYFFPSSALVYNMPIK